MASSTEEQYLKVILGLEEAGGESLVRMGDISQQMGLTAGTVTSMLKQLAGQGMVEYLPRTGCRLSPLGRTLALRLVRKHRLIETFLVRTLAYDWAEIHAEAETLEHAVSDRFIDALDQFLDHPTLDPHGSPIPGRDLVLPPEAVRQLSSCGAGQHITIARVSDSDSQVLVWLQDAGILPGRTFRIREISKLSQVLTLEAEGQEPIGLGLQLADHIFVNL